MRSRIQKISSFGKSLCSDCFSMNEDKILKSLVIWSVIIHSTVLILGQFDWGKPNFFPSEEWAIETDLVGIEAGASQDALPNAKESEELTVSDKLLPQLPKNFTLQDQKEAIPEDAMTELTDDKKAEEKIAKKEESTETLSKVDEDKSNILAKQDAMKRLAIEKLRREQKQSKENKAAKADAIARLKSVGSSAEKGTSGIATAQYKTNLRKHIGRFWSLPEAYNLKNADINVVISISINERGTPIKLQISKPSGDSAFDDLAFHAVKEAVPLPNPPKNQVGEEILLNFTPKSY